jgi:DNA invertase Pin-like site-specific DNA recombinase
LSGKYDWISIAGQTHLNHYPDILVGYTRVSILDQNLDLQRDALTRAGCERLFEGKKSCKAGTKRPEFEATLAYL